MACETPKEAWQKLKDESEGSDQVKTVKVLILKREFEMLTMKEGENVKEYSYKVKKIMICLPTRFKSKIFAIEELRDLKTLLVAELN